MGASLAGEEVVIGLDLADFFPSVPARRIHGMFQCLGYPAPVARLLAGLCTTRTPHDVMAAQPVVDRPLHRVAHLPQGAPTSPALVNLAAWQLDQRLSTLARRFGATYTRYADGLALSGDRGLTFEGGVPACSTRRTGPDRQG